MTYTRYIWQQPDWPSFHWNDAKLASILYEVALKQGVLSGRLSMLGMREQGLALTSAVEEEVISSNSIEGITLDRASVRSSIEKHLGLVSSDARRFDHYSDNTVAVLMDAVENCTCPLTKDRLFDWHEALFPKGVSDGQRILTGCWRQGSMYVVSGRTGKEVIHYEAPPAERVDGEMDRFLDFVNGNDDINPLVKVAVAHFWFVTIHPFADGNGRLARTIGEMLLARAEGTSNRCYSLSEEILANRKKYYDTLERCQGSSLDITAFILFILQSISGAITRSMDRLSATLDRTRFWDSLRNKDLNERQRKLIQRLLDGFEGRLTAEKWAKIAKCSHSTALRDISYLVAQGILEKDGRGGRSTGYQLKDA